MYYVTGLSHVFLAMTLSPLLLGIINRVKARFAGRRGQPLCQLYYDLFKLLRKGAVYSRTTTWVFRIGPMGTLAAVVMALLFVPLTGFGACVSFSGDLLLMAYLLGVGRFLTVLAAMDTGSAFEGLGASREVFFSALTEPSLILALAALCKLTGQLSLEGMYGTLAMAGTAPMVLPLVSAVMMIVLLAENARMPVDDPNTHLELTMIHEVMVLDHSGPDLAMIQYGAAIKLWIFSALLVGVLIPIRTGMVVVDGLIGLVGIGVIAVVVGIMESTMARLRLLHVPQLLSIGLVLSLVSLILVMR